VRYALLVVRAAYAPSTPVQERDSGRRTLEIDFLEDASWQRVRVHFEADLQRRGRVHVLLDDLVQVKLVSPQLLVAERLEAEHPPALRDRRR
jgi:hypothetical protein